MRITCESPASAGTGDRAERTSKCQDYSITATLLQRDHEQAERFLTLLDGDAEAFTFQTFDDNADRKDRALARVFHEPLDEVWPELIRLNALGAGVFVTANETNLKGRKKDDIRRIRAVWQEADRSETPTLRIQPHIEVESSPGKYHRYVLTDSSHLDEFEPVQARLVQDYGSDPNAADRSRVLRLPGFYHQKVNSEKGLTGTPHLVRITDESGEQPLSWEQLKAHFPPVAEKLNTRRPKGIPKRLDALETIRSALEALDPDNYKLWIDIGRALHWTGAGELAFILWDEWSQRGTSYRKGETAYKWNTFKANGGITIGTLFRYAMDAGWENPEKRTGFVDTDLANGERFARMHKNSVFYAPERGWLIWDGRRWCVDEHNQVVELAKQTARKIFGEIEKADEKQQKELFKWARQSQSRDRLRAMMELAKSEPGIPESLTIFDADPFLLNCWNGVVDLRTGRLSHHDPDHLLSKITRIEYRRDALCPLWLKFLDRIMGGDAAMIDFLQRAAGYTLTGDTSEQCLFFAFGTGANGKSVFLEILMLLLDEYATNARADTIMLKSYSSIPNDIARLVGMRFVAISETERGQRMAESQIKDMTGGDRVTARFLRKEFFDFKPEFKLWIRGNHKPRITGTDDGIWRRIHLVPFEVQIPEFERDGHLTEKLHAELPGILAWTAEGARKWLTGGLQVPDKVRAATAGYREDMDRLADFISECCIIGDGFYAFSGDLYSAYKDWCETSGDAPMSHMNFGLALAERGYGKTPYSGRKRYRGIGLKVVNQK